MAHVFCIVLRTPYQLISYPIPPLTRRIWERNPDQAPADPIKLLCTAQAQVPIVHFQKFCDLVVDLVTASSALPLFIAAAECCSQPLVELVGGFEKLTNDAPESSIASEADAEAIAERFCEQPSLAVWTCSLSFAPSESSAGASLSSVKLVDAAADVWTEFLDGHAMLPLSILVTGYPGAGKSETAASIATR
jgi:hypothetical protein